MANDSANAAVYVEEGQLETVRKMIERGAAELRPFEFISRYTTTASGQASTGLKDRQPSELTALFTRAIRQEGPPGLRG